MSIDGPILVFDGVCVLCNRSVQFVLRHDHQQLFRFASNQSVTGRALMQDHSLDPAAPASILLVDGTLALTQSAAVIAVLRRFGRGWRLLAALLTLVPARARDVLYLYVARHRYRWFGRREVCMLPEPQQRARFLD